MLRRNFKIGHCFIDPLRRIGVVSAGHLDPNGSHPGKADDGMVLQTWVAVAVSIGALFPVADLKPSEVRALLRLG